MKLMLAITLCTISSAVFAGWNSGGGELIQDAQNPWFIQNTSTVRYCTLFDKNQYHQTEVRSLALVKKAISFWKAEIKYGKSPFPRRIDVATQKFIHVPCSSHRDKNVDVTFQFGFLDDEQLDYVKDASRYAALAIRTDYDKALLKGKGFVYIGADAGPYKFKGENTVESPWTLVDGGLLYWTLVHELGHVFGFGHSRQMGEKRNVMAHDFIEVMMRKEGAKQYKVDFQMNHVLKNRPRDGEIPVDCNSYDYMQPMRKFFGYDRNWNCYGFKLVDQGLEIHAGPSGGEVRKIGTAHFTSSSFTLIRDAIHFWLPKEQKIFTPSPFRVHTPGHYIEETVAIYRSADGSVTRQMSITLDPTKDSPMNDDLKIGGVLEGKLFVNFLEGI